MVSKWRIFASVFSASRMQHISGLHSKFALKPRVEVWQTSNLRPLRIGQENDERRNLSCRI